jgi:hypothetical protein
MAQIHFEKVKNKLLEALNQNKTIYYDDLMKQVGLEYTDFKTSKNRYEFRSVLYRCNSSNSNSPILTTLVVMKDTNLPGHSYFEFAEKIGRKSKKESKENFWKKELEALLAEYPNKREVKEIVKIKNIWDYFNTKILQGDMLKKYQDMLKIGEKLKEENKYYNKKKLKNCQERLAFNKHLKEAVIGHFVDLRFEGFYRKFFACYFWDLQYKGSFLDDKPKNIHDLIPIMLQIFIKEIHNNLNLQKINYPLKWFKEDFKEKLRYDEEGLNLNLPITTKVPTEKLYCLSGIKKFSEIEKKFKILMEK